MSIERLQILTKKHRLALRAERNIRIRGIRIPTPILENAKDRDSAENARPLRIWKRWFKNHAKIQSVVSAISREMQATRRHLRIEY